MARLHANYLFLRFCNNCYIQLIDYFRAGLTSIGPLFSEIEAAENCKGTTAANDHILTQ